MPFLFIFLVFASFYAQAYPSFVSYGYNNCMTCHYAPQGGGQLNDYGRALFASEIAAKPFWNPNTTDEDLGNQSSFLLQKPGGSSFKPSLKYRQLTQTTSVGAINSQKQYIMQADLGFAYIFNPNYVLVMSAGYTRVPINANLQQGDWNYNLLSHEHYLRVQLDDFSFVSYGLMDIYYGIHFVDHTYVNRKPLGLGQNDQVHGVLYSYYKDKWQYGLHAFAGNQLRDEISRLRGATALLSTPNPFKPFAF